MSDLQILANTVLAHAAALTLAIGTIVAIGVIVVIVMLPRPRSRAETLLPSSGWPISMRASRPWANWLQNAHIAIAADRATSGSTP